MLKTVGFPSTRTGDQTIVNGNLVIGTAGKGIDFSANPNPAGMTSELLNDYEEGTWTPTAGVNSSIIGTWVVSDAKYTKIGRMVFCDVTFTGTGIGFSSSNGFYQWSGLPFTSIGGLNGTWSSDVIFNPVAGHVASGGGLSIFIYAAQSTTGSGAIATTFSYYV